MISLFFDLQGAQTKGSSMRGIGRYTRDLANALIMAPGLDEINLAWNNLLPSPLPDLSYSHEVKRRLVSAPYGAMPRRKHTTPLHDLQHDINDCLLRQAVFQSNSRHVLFSSLMETDSSNFVLPKHLNFQPHVTSYAIAYDIIPHLYHAEYLPTDGLRRRYDAHLAVKLSADIIFAISEKTRTDIIQELRIDPDRIVTIGTGIEARSFQGKGTPEALFRKRYGLLKPYLLFMGGEEFRKNIFGFVDALKYLSDAHKKSLQILIAGAVSADNQQRIKRELTENGFAEDSVIFARFLPQEDLLQAYRSCASTVIPSLYEGFGLPVLEAMACSAPVVASNNSSMAEILTETAFLFDPYQPEDIARKIDFVLTEREAVARLVTTYPATLRRHTWNQVACKIIETFEMTQRSQHQTRAIRTSMEKLAITNLGSPGTFFSDTMQKLAANHDVVVYADVKGLEALDATPLRLSLLENLRYVPQKNQPIISFVSGLPAITQFLKIARSAHHFLIIDRAAANGLANMLGKSSRPQYEQLLSEVRRAYATWLCEDNGISSVHITKKEVHITKIKDGTALSDLIVAEVKKYRRTHATVYAAELRDILKTYGQQKRRAKEVSLLAAVSVFDKRTLSSVGDQQQFLPDQSA